MNQPAVETNRPGDRSPTAKDNNTLPRGSPDAKGAFIPVSNSSTPPRGQMLTVSVDTQVMDGPKGRSLVHITPETPVTSSGDMSSTTGARCSVGTTDSNDKQSQVNMRLVHSLQVSHLPDQDVSDRSADREVATLFPGESSRGPSPTPLPKRTFTPSKNFSPIKPPNMLTNRPRGNVKSTTPSIENMTIHQLAAQGEVALLSIRHDEGYDMNEVDENGLTSLMWASSHGQVGVTVFLLENGGSVHGATREGETALSFACCKGHVEIVQALLKAGADVNAFDWNGGTPLLYAVHANHPKCVQLLLSHGADLTAETDSGQSPLGLAITLGHRTVQQVIENHMLKMLEGAVR
ncbi:ankyrin repeat family A protein 2-like isoform X1 [Branchiostoma floridae]|uniref:Ankyrin repeat family A protein 2-like isoform X1 n=2 Tax=Branchiostoma floridae TaxID=7739 RepID=A0A9J7MGU5_BRAFL|nr:ankyrin repeat family A protein 2-like isoform X1 [Branchiostoma floridae]